MNQNPFSNLTNLKAWLGDSESISDDTLLSRLLVQASRFILNRIDRDSLYKTTYTEYYDGYGGSSIVLANWPIVSVASCSINGVAASAQAQPGVSSGFFLSPWNGRPPGRAQTLNLNGLSFTRGAQNILVTYTAGFFITNEVGTVPAASPYTVTAIQPKGTFGRDDGVTLANGTALTLTTSPTPASGQYAVDYLGNYTFSASQAGAGVLISYSWIPSDIEQACIEIAAERYRYSKRIGKQSDSVAGQITTSYSLKALPDYVNETLKEYERVGY